MFEQAIADLLNNEPDCALREIQRDMDCARKAHKDQIPLELVIEVADEITCSTFFLEQQGWIS